MLNLFFMYISNAHLEQNSLILSNQVTVPMEGRTWSLSEVPEFGGNMISDCPIVSDRWPDPPAVVRQHATNQRCFVALSAQVRTQGAVDLHGIA